jgi:hypothetical protein
MAGQFPWLDFSKITWRKGQAADEGGIDISEPTGQPITALSDGDIVGAGNYWGHGVVTVRTTVPGLGQADLYYQHIQIAPGIRFCQYGNCGGQKVRRGQVLGHANWGLVETGLNPPWAGIWGPAKHPSAWVDPESYLKKLIGQSGQTSSMGTADPCRKFGPPGSDPYIHCTGQVASGNPATGGPGGPPGSCAPLDFGCWLNQLWPQIQTQFVSWGEHIAIFVLALAMIALGALMIGFPPAVNLANKVGKAAMLA